MAWQMEVGVSAEKTMIGAVGAPEPWRLTWKDPEIIVSAALFLFAISPAIVGFLIAGQLGDR